MNDSKEDFVLSETATIKDLLLCHPQVIQVLLDRGVPVSCANGTIAQAARACGLAPEALVAELAEVLLRYSLHEETE